MMSMTDVLNELRTSLAHYVNDKVAPYDQRIRALELDLRKTMTENVTMKRDMALLQRAVEVLKIKAAR